MEAPAFEVWMRVMEESRVHAYLGVTMLLGATSGPLETALKHPLYPVSVAQSPFNTGHRVITCSLCFHHAAGYTL